MKFITHTKIQILTSFLAFQEITAAHQNIRSVASRDYEQDRYNHREIRGWPNWYNTYRSAAYRRSNIEVEDDAATTISRLEEVLADPNVIILDLRKSIEIEDHDVTDADYLASLGLELKAPYKRFTYNDVKVNPRKLIYEVAQMYYNQLENFGDAEDDSKTAGENENATSDNQVQPLTRNEIYDRIGENFYQEKRIDDINLRNAPIFFLCEYDWCGCRFAFATWHGFNNVRYLQNTNTYLEELAGQSQD